MKFCPSGMLSLEEGGGGEQVMLHCSVDQSKASDLIGGSSHFCVVVSYN